MRHPGALPRLEPLGLPFSIRGGHVPASLAEVLGGLHSPGPGAGDSGQPGGPHVPKLVPDEARGTFREPDRTLNEADGSASKKQLRPWPRLP